MIILLLLICISTALDTFRQSTQYHHVSLSKHGKRLALCGKQSKQFGKDDYCEAYQMSGNSYTTTTDHLQWTAFYKQNDLFEDCCKPKFSDDQDNLYYIKRNDGALSLYSRDLASGEQGKLNSISQSYPIFNKNGDYLVTMETDSKIQILKESNAIKQVNPFNPLLTPINKTLLRRLEISEDGQVIKMRLNELRDSLFQINYYYYAGDRRVIRFYESDQTTIRIMQAWLSSSKILGVQDDNMLSFLKEHSIVDTGSNDTNSEEVIVSIQQSRQLPSQMLISPDKKYICFTTYSYSTFFSGISVIQQYVLDDYLAIKEQNLNRTIKEIPQPQLTIYQVGLIISLQISYDASIITYIRQQNKQKELVAVFHKLGEQQFVYPCYSAEHRYYYQTFCDTFPEGFQIFIFFLVFFILVALIIGLVIYCFKLRGMKIEAIKDQTKDQEEILKNRETLRIEDSRGNFDVDVQDIK